MRFLAVSIAALATLASSVLAADEGQVEVLVTRAVECERKTKRGDKISVHYRGTLQADGKQFDASYDRGQPLSFVVGRGSVIKGWDENLIDMCIGEKRTLTIPPAFGYGDRTMGPIPGKSTLIFETELVGIDGVEAPKAHETAEEAKPTEAAGSIADDAVEAIKAKVAEAYEAAKIALADTDGSGQEHNEL